MIAVLFGSTAFDAFRDSTRWLTFIQGNGWSTYLQNNLGLLGFCLAVGLIFWVACICTGVGPEQSRRELPSQFAFSVIPIVIGYIVAHYLSYFVEIGTQTLIQASDPLSNGSNLLGTGSLSVPYWLSYHPTFLADTKVLAVVIGHVVGVIAAHERVDQAAAEEAPAHRPAAAAGRDDLLHRRRALPACSRPDDRPPTTSTCPRPRVRPGARRLAVRGFGPISGTSRPGRSSRASSCRRPRP